MIHFFRAEVSEGYGKKEVFSAERLLSSFTDQFPLDNMETC